MKGHELTVENVGRLERESGGGGRVNVDSDGSDGRMASKWTPSIPAGKAYISTCFQARGISLLANGPS
jgi:hypothetical protein